MHIPYWNSCSRLGPVHFLRFTPFHTVKMWVGRTFPHSGSWMGCHRESFLGGGGGCMYGCSRNYFLYCSHRVPYVRLLDIPSLLRLEFQRGKAELAWHASMIIQGEPSSLQSYTSGEVCFSHTCDRNIQA